MTVFAVLDGVGRLHALWASQEGAWEFVLKQPVGDADLTVEPWEVQGAAH